MQRRCCSLCEFPMAAKKPAHGWLQVLVSACSSSPEKNRSYHCQQIMELKDSVRLQHNGQCNEMEMDDKLNIAVWIAFSESEDFLQNSKKMLL